MSGVKTNEFIEVPFGCPLPNLCPVCCNNGERLFKTTASEGIPFIFTYSLTIRVAYCAAHYKRLRTLQICELLAVVGIFLSPLLGWLPALINWSWRYFFYVGLAASVACLYFALKYGRRLRMERGVRMRTMGNQRAFLLRSFRPEWNAALGHLVDEYKRRQSSAGAASKFLP